MKPSVMLDSVTGTDLGLVATRGMREFTPNLDCDLLLVAIEPAEITCYDLGRVSVAYRKVGSRLGFGCDGKGCRRCRCLARAVSAGASFHFRGTRNRDSTFLHFTFQQLR